MITPVLPQNVVGRNIVEDNLTIAWQNVHLREPVTILRCHHVPVPAVGVHSNQRHAVNRREMFGLKRRKHKRIVDMTNAEAAQYYVARAMAAAANGRTAHAHQSFHSAVMHDPQNMSARQRFEATAHPPKISSL